MVSTTYAERLARAMKLSAALIAKMSADDRAKLKALAKHLGVTYTGVTNLFRDSSKCMNAPNNSKAAKHLLVDSDWLATGEGEMRSARVWPFGEAVSPDDFFNLSDDAVASAIDVVVGAVARAKAKAEPQKQLAAHG